MTLYKKAILPIGFKAHALNCGIRKSNKLDLALFYSDAPAKTAAVFTANKIIAAPLKINKKHLLMSRYFQAIIANSGNANAFTGTAGIKDAQETAKALSKALKIKKEEVLVASTGIIGKRLPAEKIKLAIPVLVKGLSLRGIQKAAHAIMTTDTFSKEMTAKFKLGGKQVTICAVAKGAGMIAPNMATMLCFIFTDAFIAQGALNKALKQAVDGSFNCITVDGCMSTNDNVILMANAAAGNPLINTEAGYDLFAKALKLITLELAKMIVKDAEGATKFIQIQVLKAKSVLEAKSVALNIANSNLFKTAVYGQNPNFGRVVAAVGSSGIDVQEKKLSVKLSPLKKKEVSVQVSLGRGQAQATVYTSDLTPEYIKINAEYN